MNAFVDDIFKVTKSMKFVFRRLENSTEKEDRLVNSIFSFSPKSFLRPSSLGFFFVKQALVSTCLHYRSFENRSFENTVEKAEIDRNEQFHLIATVFPILQFNFLLFSSNLKLLSAYFFSVWKSLKFVIWERVIKL